MFAIDVSGHMTLSRQLQLLKLPAAKRRRIAATMIRKVRGFTRKRLRGQKDLDGRAWEKRKIGNKKMLRGLSKKLRTRSDTRGAELGLSDGTAGKIAYAHQHGVPETWTASKAEKVYGKPDYEAPATRKQGKALRDEGYKVRRHNGKGWRRPTLKWVTENLTLGQAGVILRSMREEQPKKSWEIPLPSRTFMGISLQELRDLVDEFFDETMARLKRA